MKDFILTFLVVVFAALVLWDFIKLSRWDGSDFDE